MSDTGDQDSPVLWDVVVSDLAEDDLGDAYRYIAGFTGTERAQEWVEDFYRTLYELALFPGPYANARDERASAFAGRETRRLLYRGSRKRPTKTAYKAYYLVTPPAEGENEGTILIYRILHGASNWPDEILDDEDDS